MLQNLLIAWTPFIDPLGSQQSWPVLLPPLALLISIAYKAVRTPNRVGAFDLGLYTRQTLSMTVQVILAILALYVGVLLLVDWLLPMAT